MNFCRNCRKVIPIRLCFCSGCLPQLTEGERIWLHTARSAADKERIVRNVLTRLRGGVPLPKRESMPPTDPREAFREARRLLAPILGRK